MAETSLVERLLHHSSLYPAGPGNRELMLEAAAALQGWQDKLKHAFRAGFDAAQGCTDKYGEYHGDSIEEEFAHYLRHLPSPPK
jgi:hypothetical protein